jgi:hypothetical protein
MTKFDLLKYIFKILSELYLNVKMSDKNYMAIVNIPLSIEFFYHRVSGFYTEDI